MSLCKSDALTKASVFVGVQLWQFFISSWLNKPEPGNSAPRQRADHEAPSAGKKSLVKIAMRENSQMTPKEMWRTVLLTLMTKSS